MTETKNGKWLAILEVVKQPAGLFFLLSILVLYGSYMLVRDHLANVTESSVRLEEAIEKNTNVTAQNAIAVQELVETIRSGGRQTLVPVSRSL